MGKAGIAQGAVAEETAAISEEQAMWDGETVADITEMMAAIGVAAKAAAAELAYASAATKTRALLIAADTVAARREAILAANARDMDYGREKGLSAAMMDRLHLTDARVHDIVVGLRAVAAQPDPVGAVMAEWDMPSGLHIRRVRTPLGVVGVIYESRPNVTADAGALCLKAGNAVILRGGSEGFNTSQALHGCLVEGLRAAGLPEAAIQLVPTRDRAAVSAMLAMVGVIDVIVPRGGKGLVGLVQREARVPVFAHLEGIVHVYVDAAADPAKALAVVLNAKTRRTGICGAAECLLIDRPVAETLGRDLVAALIAAGVTRPRSARTGLRSRCGAGDRGRLGPRISRHGNRRAGGRRRRCRDRAYPPLRLEPYRGRADRGSRRGRTVLLAARFGDPDAQCLDPVRRWRRIRHGGGDRHRHRQDACARAGRGGTADQLQISGQRAGHRPGLGATS